MSLPSRRLQSLRYGCACAHLGRRVMGPAECPNSEDGVRFPGIPLLLSRALEVHRGQAELSPIVAARGGPLGARGSVQSRRRRAPDEPLRGGVLPVRVHGEHAGSSETRRVRPGAPTAAASRDEGLRLHRTSVGAAPDEAVLAVPAWIAGGSVLLFAPDAGRRRR
jgi:hypothetical protein